MSVSAAEQKLGDQGEDSLGAPSCAAELIAIGRRGLLFADERGDGYAAFTQGTVRRLLKIRSGAFSSELSHRFAEMHAFRKAANGEAVASARNVLEAIARSGGETHRLENRFARRDGTVWIDMADQRWRSIKVAPGNWEIVDTPPILFRRFPHQRPLPEPVRGGTLGDLLSPFSLEEPEHLLLLAYITTIPLSDIPRPLLLPHGPQGSGKSTLLKMILSVLDPTGVDDLDLGSEPRELAQVLDQHGICFFDNVVKILDWQARLLCKAATGGGFEKRRLFTDEESVILTFKRACMVSAINVPTVAPDLLDRCLLLPLERIPPEKRQREEVLWAQFEERRPAILGALLDTLARAMEVQPGLRLTNLPRMADFASWGAAASEALGNSSEKFLAAYRENVGRQTEEVLESDPIASAVRDLVTELTIWEGRPSELLKLLRDRAGDEAKTDGWPNRPDGLTKRLKTLQSTLADAGVEVHFGRVNAKRSIKLSMPVKAPGGAATASPRHEPAPEEAGTGDAYRDASDAIGTGVTDVVTEEPAPRAVYDASDASDAWFAIPTARPSRRVVL